MDVQACRMIEFRTAANGHSYRLITSIYDPLRNRRWVLVERVGIERPVVLTVEQWSAMQPEATHAAA
jgi:hypothetical protein